MCACIVSAMCDRSSIRDVDLSSRSRRFWTGNALLVGALVVSTLAGTSVGTSTAQAAATSLKLFAPHSIFNRRLPARTPLNPHSGRIVRAFTSQVRDHDGHVVVNTTQWSAPVYVVGPDAPLVAVSGRNLGCPRPEGIFAPFARQIAAVPIPPDAVPAAGTDADLIIWQPSTGRLWELWRAAGSGAQWSACWGGRFANARTSSGIFPRPFGVSASGLSILAGQIHLEDLRQHHIDHALIVGLPHTARGRVWPANRDDGTSDAPDAIPEGTRLRLRAGLDLTKLRLHPAGLQIATAIQRYGMIVSDTSGAVSLSAQDPSPLIRAGQPDPYDALLRPGQYSVTEGIPWDQLQVVSSRYRR